MSRFSRDECADPSGAELSSADLSGADLSSADLSSADLSVNRARGSRLLRRAAS